MVKRTTEPSLDNSQAGGPIDESGGEVLTINPDLAALADQVNQVDAELAPPGATLAPGDAPKPVDYGHEAAKMVDTFTALSVGYCEATAGIWTDAKKGAVTAALAPVLEKYGVTMDALPPELVLIFVAGPPLWQTSKTIAAQMKADQAERARQKAEKAAQAGQPRAAAPTGETGGAPATAVHPQTKLYS